MTVVASVRRGVRGAVLAAGLFSLGVNLLMLTVPLYMLQIFDRVLNSRSLDTLLALSIVAMGALVTLGLLDAVRSFVFVRLGGWLERKLGSHVLAGSVVTAGAGGGASVQGLRDLTTVRTFVASPGMNALLDAPWIPIFLAVIFLLHPMLGWLALAGALFLLSLACINELATRRPLLRAGDATIQATQKAEAAVHNADVVAAMGMAPALVTRWHRQSGAALDQQLRIAGRNASITSLSKFVRLSLQLGVLGVAATFVIAGELTAGAMIAASILMGRALAPVDLAIGTWRSAVGALGAYHRVIRQLAGSDADQIRTELPVPTGHLTVEGITYVYAEQSEPIIRNVGFALEPGESLGLIGPAAAGKTTLARLLIGNLIPRFGHVRLDGADMSQLSTDRRNRHIGYVPQDVELFGGTVRENIARLREADDGVVAAAQLVGAHDMILRLPQGYETEIGPGGAALSGGQRQWIALARAVYGDPRLLVLDEPNANLDADGEAALLRALQALKDRGVTVVVIAHRPSVLQQVDKVLLLRQGGVQLFGSRAEILPRLITPAPAATIASHG